MAARTARRVRACHKMPMCHQYEATQDHLSVSGPLCGGTPSIDSGNFVEVCRRKGLRVNTQKSKVMVMNGEEELECKVVVDSVTGTCIGI